MSLVFNTKTYTADSFQQNKVGYAGASKTVSSKDDLALTRQSPKASTSFSGLGRTTAKKVRTLPLTNALSLTGDMYINVEVAVPVGAASADVDAQIDDMAALISSADFKTHVKSQKINF